MTSGSSMEKRPQSQGSSRILIWRLVVLLQVLLGSLSTTASLPSPKDYEVTGLPGQPEGLGPMHAGYVPISGVLPNTTNDGFLFFWLHESQGSKSDPLIIWLNGGPGCSSLLGMMFECGPLRFNETGGLEINPYSWTKAAHVLFVEQPVETGYSYSPDHRMVDDEKHLARDFYSFLRNWLAIFKEKSHLDIFIFGESYAGMYAPAIANEVLKQNAEQKVKVHLKGIAIGNGWVDSYIQTASYPNYAFGHGLVDAQGKQWLTNEWISCLARTENVGTVTAGDLASCRIMEKALDASGNPNEYDVTIYTPYQKIMDPKSPFAFFLNSKDVQSAVHVTTGGSSTAQGALSSPFKWQVCNDNMVMKGDHPVSMVHIIAELLKDHIQVLVYNGEDDLNCNYLGTAAYLDAMNWARREEWLTAPRYLWKADKSNVSGFYKTISNLGFLIVRNSGHLVPMDRPKEALDLAHRFTRGLTFADQALPAPWLPESASNSYGMGHGASTTTTPPREPGPHWESFSRTERLFLMVGAFVVGAILALLLSTLFASYIGRSGYESVRSDNSPRTVLRLPSGLNPARIIRV